MITETRYADKPAVVMPEERLVRECRDCKRSYVTSSRVSKRCAACGVERKRVLAVKAQRKARAKRAGRTRG